MYNITAKVRNTDKFSVIRALTKSRACINA